MNTSENRQLDSIGMLIFNEGLRIQALDFHPELDLMNIILNTKVVLKQQLSEYPLLKNASKNQLLNYVLTGSGVGIHWPDLDEDLSLKGFLENTLRKVVNPHIDPLAA